MATGKADLAALVRDYQAKTLGMSTSRLQDVATADLDALANLIKKGPPLRKHRVGGFYGGDGTYDTLLLTEDVMVLGPLVWEEFAVIEEIGVDVTTAGTEGDLYTALYADNGGYPGELVHASAALTVTAAFKSTASLDIELPPGLYWAGAVCNQVTTTVATVRSLINNSPYVGGAAGADDINKAGYSFAGVTGAPANASIAGSPTVVAEVPNILLKVKKV
jgi:hypothetical protein